MRIALRCFITFVFLLAIVRVSGKRTVNQGTPFDFVLSLMVGDLVDDAIYAEVPISNFIVAAGSLVLLELVFSILVFKNERLLWWLEGRPGLILENGNLNRQVMRNETLNEQDIKWLLRLQGLEKEKWHQIRLATIEADGQPACLRTGKMKEAQKSLRKWLRKKDE